MHQPPRAASNLSLALSLPLPLYTNNRMVCTWSACTFRLLAGWQRLHPSCCREVRNRDLTGTEISCLLGLRCSRDANSRHNVNSVGETTVHLPQSTKRLRSNLGAFLASCGLHKLQDVRLEQLPMMPWSAVGRRGLELEEDLRAVVSPRWASSCTMGPERLTVELTLHLLRQPVRALRWGSLKSDQCSC